MRICQCVPASYSTTCDRRFWSDHQKKELDQSEPNRSGTDSVIKRILTQSNNYRNRLLDGWPCPLADSCDDDWTWNNHDRSHEAKLYGPRARTVLFHPGWSNGTAAVRGTKPLLAPFQNGYKAYYWEIDVSHRVFGTSLMFGVGTKKADLHAGAFINLIGKDKNSWALNHKGEAWHDGCSYQFVKPFQENTPTTVSLLLDWTRDGGVLEYFKDGKSLGVAFRDLEKSILEKAKNGEEQVLYPMIGSTAARTEMCLVSARRPFASLQDHCLWEIAKCLKSRPSDVDSLELPDSLRTRIRKRVLNRF